MIRYIAFHKSIKLIEKSKVEALAILKTERKRKLKDAKEAYRPRLSNFRQVYKVDRNQNVYIKKLEEDFGECSNLTNHKYNYALKGFKKDFLHQVAEIDSNYKLKVQITNNSYQLLITNFRKFKSDHE
jgi:hypothetical protein